MAKILIVDDEKSIRMTLAEFIREDGHEVFTAEDAPQALQLLVEKDPAVVVTDIILPRMTGIALLKQINEIAPDIQVLMITGEPTAETATEAVRLGAFDYLSKPIARTDFKSSVTSALRVTEIAQDRRRLEEENLRYQEHLEEEVEKKTGALRESEEKYRAVVENASEAVFVAQDGVLPFANPSTSGLSGRSLEELRTISFIEWIHPEDRAIAANRCQRWRGGEDAPSRYGLQIIRPNGETRFRITLTDPRATLDDPRHNGFVVFAKFKLSENGFPIQHDRQPIGVVLPHLTEWDVADRKPNRYHFRRFARLALPLSSQEYVNVMIKFRTERKPKGNVPGRPQRLLGEDQANFLVNFSDDAIFRRFTGSQLSADAVELACSEPSFLLSQQDMSGRISASDET